MISKSINNILPPMVKTLLLLSAVSCWNKTQNMLGGQLLKSLHPTKIKNILTQRCISKYNLLKY